jgi:hypothetical protein
VGIAAGLGNEGVLVEIALQTADVIKVRRKEIVLHARDADPARVAAQLSALAASPSVEHMWVQWKLDSTAVCIVLERAKEGEAYDGRNWFPYSLELDKMMESSEKEAKKATKKYTLQHSFPISSLPSLVSFVQTSLPASFGSDRVVEIKFLQGAGDDSSKYAPNSGIL